MAERREEKYLIDYSEYSVIASRIRELLTPDKTHVTADIRSARSISTTRSALRLPKRRTETRSTLNSVSVPTAEAKKSSASSAKQSAESSPKSIPR